MKRLTLQWRITLLAAFVLAACAAALTAYSIESAENTFVPMIPVDTAVSVESTALMEKEFPALAAAPVYEAKRSYDTKNILFAIAVSVTGGAAVFVVTGRALRPVRQLAGSVSSVDEHNLSASLPEAPSRDEVGELTRGFNRMLARLNEAFSRQKRFTASAAHELKTPLATMKAGIQVLSMDEDSTLQEYRDNAQMMEKSIDRLSQVVDGLLLLASAGERAEAGKEQVDIGTLCEAIWAELEPLYGNRNLQCRIDCRDIELCGNPALLYQVFYNLIENACKYNRQDGNITICGGKTGGSICVEIRDTGYGIDREHLPMIFEAFYREDNSRSRRIGGSGLGLSLVKAIVEQYGGTIDVKSTKGEGTVFNLELPHQ